jgi:two-component system LytT family response regulator
MINSIIIDDEPKNIRILRKILSEFCPQVNVIAEAKDAKQGLDVINHYKPELVFLDIEMPYGNAFDLIDKLMPVNFEIIFITAFNEYALRAFKYSALDYLLKPVNIDELKIAVAKAEERGATKNLNVQLNNLLHNLHTNNVRLHNIAIPSKGGVMFVAIKDVYRCEASGSYTYIYTRENGKIISSKSIREYEAILPSNIFFRVHHSHIINLNEIKRYNHGRGGYVEMNDGALIDVAVRRKEEFLSRFKMGKNE